MNDNSDRFAQCAHVLAISAFTAWLIFNLAQTVGYISNDYSRIPIADYWRVPQYWPEYQSFHWSKLWVQHNEHRIVFPELIYIADMFLLHGRMYLPIALSGVCYVGVWLVLLWATYSQKSAEWPERESALLLAGIVIVWKGCSSVIATPFQLSLTMLQFAAATAFAFLAKLSETGSRRYLALLVGAAVVCTYSSANGMLIWPVLVSGAVFVRLKKRDVLTISVGAAIFISVYFIRYRFLPSQIQTNLRHPILALEFLCSYLSMPFGSFRAPSFGITVGAVNLLLMGGLFSLARLRGALGSRLGVVLFGQYIFILLGAILVAAGRMEINDVQFAQAKAWRYVTMPTEGWALLALAIVWLVAEVRPRNWALYAEVLIAGFFVYGFLKAGPWVEASRRDYQNAQVTATMLENHVFQPDQVRTIFPDSEFVRAVSTVLKDDRKALWAHGGDKWIGQDVTRLQRISTPMAGKITRVYPVPGGLELFGWADSNTLTTDHDVLFVDARNRIAGFGGRPKAGMPSDLSAWDTPRQLAFVGFVSLDRAVSALSVYVRTTHGKAIQPLFGSVGVPAFTQIAGRSDGPVLPNVSWRADPNWTLNGYPVGGLSGPAPIGPIYGSLSKSDLKKGAIFSSAFPTPSDHCLVLPVLHGASSFGQSVEVLDADGIRQIIAKLPMLDGRSVWERWRISIPNGSQHLMVTADDQGTDLNQWVALATPQNCP